jgi:hypothetical protein
VGGSKGDGSLHKTGRIRQALCAGALVALMLAGCAPGTEVEAVYPEAQGRQANPKPSGERDTVFGPGGLNFLGGRKDDGGGGGGGGIGVNSFLWRASLDTLSFLPLASADPFGGVIITDWYSPPETPEERFKLTVYILDRRLRADGLKISVFRQRRTDNADWRDVAVNADTSVQLENAILTRARQLRLATLEQ